MAQRVCFTLQVRPDRMAEYRERHQAVWPQMLQALAETGWSNYSLFLSQEGLLVGYVETEDFAAAQAAMTELKINMLWQAEMAPFFVDKATADESFVVLQQVFNLDEQLAALGQEATK